VVGIAPEQHFELIRKLGSRREEERVLPVPENFSEARTVVQSADRNSRAEKLGELHRQVQAGGRTVEADAQVGRPDYGGILLRG
jgi:hypothetical protein